MPDLSENDKEKLQEILSYILGTIYSVIKKSEEIKEEFDIIKKRDGFDINILSISSEFSILKIDRENNEEESYKDPTPIEITSMDEKFLKALHISSDNILEI